MNIQRVGLSHATAGINLRLRCFHFEAERVVRWNLAREICHASYQITIASPSSVSRKTSVDHFLCVCVSVCWANVFAHDRFVKVISIFWAGFLSVVLKIHEIICKEVTYELRINIFTVNEEKKRRKKTTEIIKIVSAQVCNQKTHQKYWAMAIRHFSQRQRMNIKLYSIWVLGQYLGLNAHT